MQEVLLEEFPDAQLNILVVWLKMYAAESLEVAQQAAKLFSSDARVAQFYDPDKISGLEMAEAFGAEPAEVAWDVYLFYKRQEQWIDQIPQPADWAHQLESSHWADPNHLFMGDKLTVKLRDMMQNMVGSRSNFQQTV